MEQEPKMPKVGEAQKSDDELKEFVEMHEFPNRTVLKDGGTDLNGKEIPAKSVLFYQPDTDEGVKVENEIIYGKYMDEKGDSFWVSIKDADYGAQKKSGFTKARL